MKLFNNKLTQVIASLFLFGMPAAVLAQTTEESAPMAKPKAVFPSMNLVDVKYEHFFPYEYGMKRDGNRIEMGENKQQRVKAGLLIPFYMKNKWIVNGQIRYKYEKYDFENVEHYRDSLSLMHDDREEYHFFVGAIRATYQPTLWGKPALFTASVFADGSNKELIERVNVDALGKITLYKDETTTFDLGLVATTSPTAIFYGIPFFMLEHKLNEKWTLDLVFPQSGYLRRSIGSNGRLSGGVSYVSELSFIYPDQSTYAHSAYTYSRNEIREELLYEHSLAPGLVFNVRGGGVTEFWNKMKKKNTSDKFVTTWAPPVHGFVGIGVSYMPQIKKK